MTTTQKTLRFNHFTRFSCAALAAAALFTAAGCAPVVIGSAAVGTALVATDRRTSGAQVEDEGIELRASSRIGNAVGERAHINVTSFNRQVLLTGEVPSAEVREQIVQIVRRVENVRSVVDELAVLGNTSLSQRSSDALITAKVKAGLVDQKDIFANAFKVVTERGIVYLMGRVTEREATRATEIARGTSGVLKVVRVFEIISEEELRNLSTQPAADAASK